MNWIEMNFLCVLFLKNEPLGSQFLFDRKNKDKHFAIICVFIFEKCGFFPQLIVS
jgi:hypothetical protein